MKPTITCTINRSLGLILAAGILFPQNIRADVIKANNSTALTNGLSWVSGTVPGPGDVAVFDSTLYLGTNANTISPAPLGGNLSILGIRVAGPVLGQADGKNGIVITNTSSANTLTIGTSGIDLSAPNAVPLDLQSKITLGGSQTWNISDASANITNPVPVLPLPAAQNHGDRYTALLANEDEDLYFNALVAGTPFDLGGFTLNLTNSGSTVIDQGYTVANGVINVNQGTLAIQGGKSRQTTISNNVTINVAGGATLRLQTTSGAIISSAAINLADGSLLNLAAAGAAAGIVSNNIAVSGNATLSQTQNPIVGGNNNTTNIVAANITGDPDATLNLVPSQSGTATCVLQLSGDNSGFGGDININALTGIRPVRLSTATAGSANASWTVSASNILQVAGVAVALGGLNGSGTISNSVAATTATINVGNGDFSGNIANAGTAVMALNKISASTLILERTNTYTGPTAVSNGTLLVNGSLASRVTVYSGGTVGGTGTIRSNLIANAGGTVAPGSASSIGTLTVSGTVTNGGTILMKLDRDNAQTSDQLSCAKTITITAGGTLTVINTGTALQVGDSFKLFSAASYSSLIGLVGSADLPSLQAGFAWNTLGLTNNGTISVVAEPTVVISPAATNFVYGNSVTLTATTNGTGPLAIQWYDNNAHQIPNETNSTLTLIGPGVPASGNYAVVVTSPFGSATNIALVTIAPANLLITAQPQTITYGASVPATTVTYDGFVNGDTASSLTTQPSVMSAQSGIVAADTYPGNYTASGAADPNYSISYIAGSLTVHQASLTITAQPQTIIYGASVPATTVTYDGFVNGDTASSLTTQPTVSSAQSGMVAAGTYSDNYTASGAVDLNYSISYVPGDLTVTQGSLTITAQPQTITYGASVPATTVTYDGFVNGDTADNLTTQPTVVSAQSGVVSVGTYPDNYTASGAVDDNYTISYNSGTLTVNPLAVILTGIRTYDGTDIATNSILSVTNAVGGDDVSLASGSGTLASTNVGTNAIISFGTLSLGGTTATNYTLIDASGSVTVTPAPLLITAQPQTITYGASVPATTVTYDGFVNGETNTELSTEPTISSAEDGVVAAGTYPGNYTASGAVDPNYSISYVPGDLIVDQASLTIMAQPQTITYGASVPATTVTYDGFVNGDTADSLTTQPSVVSAQSGIVAVGTYPGNYTASGATDPNYSISYVPADLVVGQASLAITAQPQTITYGASVPATTVTYDGFVNGDTADSLTTQPTVVSAQSGIVAVGTYPGNYTASGATDPNYSISYVPADLVVGQASLAITAQPQTITYGASVPATTVTYDGFVNGDTADSLTTQPTVVSAQSGVVGAGTYPDNYTASGAVDDNYTISYNSGTLTVNPLAVVLTGTREYDGTDIATNSILSVTNAVGGDDVSLASGSGTLTNANVGTNAITSFGTLALGGTTATNYTLIGASGSVTVTPVPLLIAAQPQTITYGASVPATTVTYSGFVNGETNTALSTDAAISSAQSGVVAAGTYSDNYTASGAVDPNYAISYVPADLVVGQASLTITAQPQTITYGASVPATTVTYDGFVNGDTADSLTTQPSVVSAQSGIVAVGTYPGNYTASGAVDLNYSISYVPGALTVSPAPQPTVVGIVVSNETAIITLAGTNGVTYVTQSTTNLTVNAWIPISTNTPGIGGNWTVTNSIVNEPQMFYRTLIP